MDLSKVQKLRSQVEYYMSDQNLKNDKFFHHALKTAPERLIPVELLMNCKKIKQHSPSNEEIIKAIEDSSYLKMNEDKTRFGRLNRHLPILRDRMIFVTLDKEYTKNQSEIDLGDKFIHFTPFIIRFKTEKRITMKNHEFRKKLKKAMECDIPFIKLYHKKGNLVFNHNKMDHNQIGELIEKKEFKLRDYVLVMEKLDEENTKLWLDINRLDLEKNLKMKYHSQIKKINRHTDPTRKVFYEDNYGPVEILDKKFIDFRQLKGALKSIVNRTKNGAEIDPDYIEFVKKVLSYHDDKEKLANLKTIVVDIHPEYKISR